MGFTKCTIDDRTSHSRTWPSRTLPPHAVVDLTSVSLRMLTSFPRLHIHRFYMYRCRMAYRDALEKPDPPPRFLVLVYSSSLLLGYIQPLRARVAYQPIPWCKLLRGTLLQRRRSLDAMGSPFSVSRNRYGSSFHAFHQFKARGHQPQSSRVSLFDLFVQSSCTQKRVQLLLAVPLCSITA